MPPPQHLLGSRIRGFVCRSCSSKLQTLQRQRTPLASRNLNTAATTKKGDRKDVNHNRTPTDAGAEVKYYEETPDGARKEVDPGENDAEERALSDSIEREVRELEKKSGKSIEEITGILTGDQKDVEKAMQRNMTRILRDGLGEMDLGPSEEQMAKLEEQGKEMDIQRDLIESYGGIDKMKNLSEKERLKVRDVLLAPMRRAMERSRYVPTTSSFPGTKLNATETTPSPAVLVKEPLLLPIHAFPEHAQVRIAQLNAALFPAAAPPKRSIGRQKRLLSKTKQHSKDLTPKENRQEIWRAYILCRKTLVERAEFVPRRFWNSLWNKLAKEGPDNMDRMGHIKYLGDDMQSCGIPMTPRQRLLYIEAMYIDDDRNLAIQAWEDIKHDKNYHLETLHYHNDKRFFQVSFWELGIRMFSLNGQPDRAFEAAEALFGVTKDPGAYRSLLPIAQSYLQIGDSKSIQRAWALYVQMRLQLGSGITMQDYDNIISVFFESNQPYLALGVFKDMMLTGNTSLADRDSIAPYQRSLDTEANFSAQISTTEVDWRDSKVLGKLPARFNNKFFFGSWIKKLIGDGELELAKKVFDLMEDRKIIASPIHLNGLVGAWYRQGSERYRILAEDTAWRMIHARIEYVQNRDRVLQEWHGLEGPVHVVKTKDLPADKRLSYIPQATIETFAILIQQYRRRQRTDLTPALFEALKQAKVKANTCFLNELLLSDARKSNVGWAWDTYNSLTSSKQVRPDIETYIILWNFFRKNADPIVKFKDSSRHGPHGRIPSARLVFGDMIKHLSSKALRVTIPKELYDSIILTFSLAQDQVGTAVALRAMQRKFNVMPSEDTLRMVTFQLSRLGMEDQGGLKGKTVRMNHSSPATKQRIATVTKILEKFKDERVEALRQRGIEFSQLNDVALLEETELLLSDLLQYVAQKKKGENYDSTKHCRDVAMEMGVPDCIPWEPSA